MFHPLILCAICFLSLANQNNEKLSNLCQAITLQVTELGFESRSSWFMTLIVYLLACRKKMVFLVFPLIFKQSKSFKKICIELQYISIIEHLLSIQKDPGFISRTEKNKNQNGGMELPNKYPSWIEFYKHVSGCLFCTSTVVNWLSTQVQCRRA